MDDNYARCNIAMLETARYTKAANFEGCKITMQEEEKIIEFFFDCNVVDSSVYDLRVFQNDSGDFLDYAESDDVKTTSIVFFHLVVLYSIGIQRSKNRSPNHQLKLSVLSLQQIKKFGQ